MVRCYDRTKKTLDYFAEQIASKLGLGEKYVADGHARLFVEKLDYDFARLNEFVSSKSSLDGRYLVT